MKLAPIGSDRAEVRFFVNHFQFDEIFVYDSFRCICSTHVSFVVCLGSHERGFSLSHVEGVLEQVCTAASFLRDYCRGNSRVHCHGGIQRLSNWNGYVTSLGFCVLLNC